MYRVKVYFTDLQDNNHPYTAGDTYPRAGLEVSADRLAELSGCNNLRKIPLIEKVKEAPTEEAPKPKKRSKKTTE